MRSRFPELVERGRIREGSWGTETGNTWGSFHLKHPRTGQKYVVMVGDLMGWDHVSVSTKKRTPSWDEMCWIKNLFFESTECVVQYHPAVEDYISVHDHCLHLWRSQEDVFPMPPLQCV